MFKNILLFLPFILLSSCIIFRSNQYLIQSDLSIANKYKEQINSKDLSNYLSVLASDEFEGRETSYPGQKKAALYLQSKLIKWGVNPPIKSSSFFQEF